MDMLISIIIPVYNSDTYLSACIDSVLRQRYPHFELLLVDDGSTDESGRICDRYAQHDGRITVIHQANAGVSSARNAGLAIAKGEYVTFIDSDDTVTASYLADFLPHLADLAIQGVVLEQKGGRLQYLRFDRATSATGEGIKQLLVTSELNSTSKGPVAKLYRRSIIEKHHLRFDPQYSYGEDHLFVLEFFKRCQSVSVIDKVNYTYYQLNENSLTNRLLPYKEVSNYARAAYNRRKEFIASASIENEGYRRFILEERAHLIYQAIYALYTLKGNHCKTERLEFLDSVYKQDYEIMITATRLPLIFQLMKLSLRLRNRHIVDAPLLILSRGKEFIKRFI